MDKQILNVQGMSCASCAGQVEKVLKKLDGVEEAAVNFAAGKVAVTYDSKVIRLSAVKEAISKAGYRVAEVQDEDREIKALWIKFIISAVFSCPLLYIAMAPMVHFIALPFGAELHHMMADNSLFYALLQLALTIPVIGVGYKFYTVGFKLLWQRSPNMDSLIALSTTAAMM